MSVRWRQFSGPLDFLLVKNTSIVAWICITLKYSWSPAHRELAWNKPEVSNCLTPVTSHNRSSPGWYISFNDPYHFQSNSVNFLWNKDSFTLPEQWQGPSCQHKSGPATSLTETRLLLSRSFSHLVFQQAFPQALRLTSSICYICVEQSLQYVRKVFLLFELALVILNLGT